MRVLEVYLEGQGRDTSANTSAGTGLKDVNHPSLEFHIISLVSVDNNLGGFEITALKLYLQVGLGFGFFFFFLIF